MWISPDLHRTIKAIRSVAQAWLSFCYRFAPIELRPELSSGPKSLAGENRNSDSESLGQFSRLKLLSSAVPPGLPTTEEL